MNVSVQICGLIIILVIMRFFYGTKRIGLYTERVFSRALLCAFVSLSLDILSIVSINYWGESHPVMTELLCKAYLATLSIMGISGFDYVLSDILNRKNYRKVAGVLFTIMFLETVAIMILPVYWYHDNDFAYSFGPSTVVTKIITPFFILGTIAVIFTVGKRITYRRKMAVGFWMLMWISSAGIQLVFKELLLVGFAITLGMLIIFMVLENPEAQLDRRYGCFNGQALILYMRQLYDKGNKVSLVNFSIDQSDLDQGYSERNNAIKMVVDMLNENKRVKVFRYLSNQVVVVSDNVSISKEVIDKFKKKYNEIMENHPEIELPDIKILVLDDSSRTKTPEDMFSLNARMRSQMSPIRGIQVLVIGPKEIERFYRHKEIVREITEALDEDRVEVFLQPIHSNYKKQFVSCEALARIRDKEGKLISPGEFIPVAEETGLITQLGERVLVKVCDYLSNNADVLDKLEYVEINLSAVQFEDDDLSDKFMRIIWEHNIDPKKINFEITESAAISMVTSFTDNLHRFLNEGIAFSLDDFGKGQSNLMYVVKMPVSIIKLDFDLIKAYFAEPKAKYVLAATVRMAHELGLHVVAEGVEEKEELAAMMDENIDFIQGYYFSKPLPMSDFTELLTR